MAFIKINRIMTEWEWYTDNDVKALFIHLLLMANFHESKWRGVELKPGQLITGRLQLKEQTGMSEQKIRTCLEKLERTGEINQQTTNRFTTITICNYYSWIDEENENNEKSTNKQPANNQQTTTSKNLRSKEDKNITAFGGNETSPDTVIIKTVDGLVSSEGLDIVTNIKTEDMKRKVKLSPGALISVDSQEALDIKKPQDKITDPDTLIIQDGQSAEALLQLEESFNSWWKVYDYNAERAECRRMWADLKPEERQKCLDTVNAYVAGRKEKKYRKVPKKYLATKGWQDEIVDFRKDNNAKAAPGSVAKLDKMDYDEQIL